MVCYVSFEFVTLDSMASNFHFVAMGARIWAPDGGSKTVGLPKAAVTMGSTGLQLWPATRVDSGPDTRTCGLNVSVEGDKDRY